MQNLKTKIYDLPSEEEIETVMKKAKSDAICDASQFGMGLDKNILENYQICLFETREIEDEYEEICSEDESNYNFDFPEELEENSSSCEDKRFIEISCPNGTKKVLRKSTLIWQFSENNTKISNDRSKRVQVSNNLDIDIAFYACERRRQSII